ncbi:hypothetical protein A9C11_26240 [Pseudomonas citronellolis]|uniref:Uncharacterized protein n=1 Tax=Pseudomonas citronellolis TaxID=53408 RepID=A0A1A9KIF9_9PSED|nr:hypothetical protein A9C11_26240 [Pseudomonas citronellolis]
MAVFVRVVIYKVPTLPVGEVGIAELGDGGGVQVYPGTAAFFPRFAWDLDLSPMGCIGGAQYVRPEDAAEAQQFIPGAGALGIER